MDNEATVETAVEETPATEETSYIADNAEEILGSGEPEGEDFMSVISEKLSELEEPTEVTEEKVEDLEEKSDFPTEEEAAEAGLDEKATIKWGELRGELDQTRKELSELRDQSVVSELESQLNELKELNQTYEQEIAISRVEKSAEYIGAVTEPMQRIMDSAKNIADSYEGVSEETMYDILGMDSRADQNEALGRVTEEMSERDKISLFRMVDDMEVIWQRDEHLKERATEALAELEYRETQESEEMAKREALNIRSGVSKVFESLEGKTPDIGVELNAIKDSALKEDFSVLNPANKAFAIAAGSMLTPMIKALRQRDAKINELSDDLKKFRASDPKIDTQETDVSPSVEGGSIGDSGFLEGITKGLTDMGVRLD